MTVLPDEWLSVGSSHVRLHPAVARLGASAVRQLGAGRRGRLVAERWNRYAIDLAGTPAPPPEVRLERVSDAFMLSLLDHPDRQENQLKSAFRFWQAGFRRAFAWIGEEGPLCIQCLMTPRDNPRIAHLGEWAGMYPPLPLGCGRVENLFVFSTARRKGVATLFELALFEEARRRGLVRIVTHIHEGNASANHWAERMRWQPAGTITRLQLDVPGLRRWKACLHSGPAPSPSPQSTRRVASARLEPSHIPHSPGT